MHFDRGHIRHRNFTGVGASPMDPFVYVLYLCEGSDLNNFEGFLFMICGLWNGILVATWA